MSTATMVLITGNTYPVKDSLKAMGGRWDANAKGWSVPEDKADAARALVTAAPRQPYTGPRRAWSKPGDGGPRGHRAGGCYMCGSYYCEGARGGLCDDD